MVDSNKNTMAVMVAALGAAMTSQLDVSRRAPTRVKPATPRPKAKAARKTRRKNRK